MSYNKPIKRIAIVGTGVIGASWAAEYLARGFEVVGHNAECDSIEVQTSGACCYRAPVQPAAYHSVSRSSRRNKDCAGGDPAGDQLLCFDRQEADPSEEGASRPCSESVPSRALPRDALYY